MKKTLLAVALVGFAVVGKAQLQKGNVMVGGEFANFNLNTARGGNFNISLTPKAGWFIKNNTALGAYVDFNLSTAKGAGTSIGYGVGAFGRYYLSNEDWDMSEPYVRRTRFFGEANVGIEGFNPVTGDNTNGLGLGIGPGVAYFITPNIGLEALLKYRNIVGFGSTASSGSFGFSLGFQIYLQRRSAERLINEVR